MGRATITWCDQDGCDAQALGKPSDWQTYMVAEGNERTAVVRFTYDYCPLHARSANVEWAVSEVR